MALVASSWAIWLLIGLALLAANLPFINNRLFIVGPKFDRKPVYWHLFELTIYAVLVWFAGRYLETYLGQAAPLRWEFFVTWGCLFITLSFPGFVWRFLRRTKPKQQQI